MHNVTISLTGPDWKPPAVGVEVVTGSDSSEKAKGGG